MPRFLVADRPELWRRLERTPLCREGAEIVLARSAAELAERARRERFDLVVDEETGTAELLACPGLTCRRVPRSRVALRVEAEGLRARTKDASPEGLFLIDAPDLPEGATLEARLRRAGGRKSVRVSLAVVRRVDAPADSHLIRGLAVRVLHADPDDMARLRSWLVVEEEGPA